MGAVLVHQLQVSVVDVLGAAHEPDDVVSRPLEEFADVKKRRLHQQAVLQHHDIVVHLHEGDDSFSLKGDGNIPVFRRHQALPLALPALRVALLQL